MKKIEIGLWILFIVLITLRISLIKIPGVIFLLLLGSLSFLYFALSFFILNGIQFKEKSGYKSLNGAKIPISIIAGISFSAIVSGTQFYIMSFPGAGIMLIGGIIISIAAVIVSFILYKKLDTQFKKRVYSRIIILCVFAAVIFFTPHEKKVELLYRDYPDYVKAVKEAEADPDNDELRDKVNQEWKKM